MYPKSLPTAETLLLLLEYLPQQRRNKTLFILRESKQGAVQDNVIFLVPTREYHRELHYPHIQGGGMFYCRNDAARRVISIMSGFCVHLVILKGVGPSTTLAWPGWKQPDIPMEVDTA
jgi:hypothetical protein